MHIPHNSIASLFQQLQSAASGSSTSSSFSASLTGQNLPTLSLGAASTSSQAPSPLSSTPSSQFTSAILSALVAIQQTSSSAPAATNNPNGDGALSLSQVEQSLTGSSATTSPQQTSIANAFAQLDTNADGSLSQGELATALQSLQQPADPTQPTSGRHHHHHHMQAQAGSSANDPATSTSSDSTTGEATSNDATASAMPPTISAAA